MTKIRQTLSVARIDSAKWLAGNIRSAERLGCAVRLRYKSV